MTDEHYESQIDCPKCKTNKIQTAVSYTTVRGMLIAYQINHKRFAGCVGCAGSELRKEAGRQLLYGWLSISALVMTVGLVPWNFGRSFFIKPNKTKVVELFQELGVPTSAADADFTASLYAAVAAMVLADGKIDQNELKIAREASARFIPVFSEARLDEFLRRPALPVNQIGALLKDALTDDGKNELVSLLVEIAKGDGEYHKSEQTMLRGLCESLNAPQAAFDRIAVPA